MIDDHYRATVEEPDAWLGNLAVALVIGLVVLVAWLAS